MMKNIVRFLTVSVILLLLTPAITFGYLYGVDISHWQGTINWDSMNASTDFVIMKASQSVNIIDSEFNRNQSEARRVGILRGYYHYAMPQYNNAVAEADFFCWVVGPLLDGEILVLDYEESYYDPVGWSKAFLDRVYALTGVKPFVYINKSTESSYNWSSVINAGYPIWLAYPDYYANPNTPSTQWLFNAMKQYSWEGSVAGIYPIDLNVFNGDASQFQAYGTDYGLYDGPSACSMNNNRLDLVSRGEYGQILLTTWTSSNGWSLTDLGGVTNESPVIVSRTDGILDAFCASTAGILHQNHYENGSWSGWQNLGQNLGSGPAVCSQNSNNITVCARNAWDNHVYVRNWTTSGGWGNWVCLYGTTYDSPAIISRADGILDVFVRGPNGNLYQQSSSDGGATWWSGWYDHGFVIGSSPAGVSRHSGNIELFYRGTNSNLMGYYWDSSTGWNFADHYGQMAGVPAVCNRTSDSLDIFVRGVDNNLYQLGWTASGGWWTGFYNMGAY